MNFMLDQPLKIKNGMNNIKYFGEKKIRRIIIITITLRKAGKIVKFARPWCVIINTRPIPRNM